MMSVHNMIEVVMRERPSMPNGKQSVVRSFERTGNLIALPDFQDAAELIRKPPPLDEELILGVLRRGQKMSLNGGSKAGKSFALIHLAIAISMGLEWLGYPCQKGHVLYANFEISAPSFANRLKVVSQKKGVILEDGQLDILNLRGTNSSFEDLVPALINQLAQTSHKKYGAIILDPVYKMFVGTEGKNFNENNASDIARALNSFDSLIQATGASVVMAGHFSKGAQGARSIIDRQSGSGVLARDPDAIITLTELEKTDKAYRLEKVLRDFDSSGTTTVIWDYPLHVPAPELNDEPLKGEVGRRKKCSQEEMEDAFFELEPDEQGSVDLPKFLSLCNASINTVRSRIREMNSSGTNVLQFCIKGQKIYTNQPSCSINNQKP